MSQTRGGGASFTHTQNIYLIKITNPVSQSQAIYRAHSKKKFFFNKMRKGGKQFAYLSGDINRLTLYIFFVLCQLWKVLVGKNFEKIKIWWIENRIFFFFFSKRPRHCRCAAPIRSIHDLLMEMTRLHFQIKNGVLYMVMIGQVKTKKDESAREKHQIEV